MELPRQHVLEVRHAARLVLGVLLLLLLLSLLLLLLLLLLLRLLLNVSQSALLRYVGGVQEGWRGAAVQQTLSLHLEDVGGG